MNNIPEHFLKKIQEAKEKQLKVLDLSCDWKTSDDQKLTIIPAKVFGLEQLEVLNLSNNQLTAVPNAIAQLRKLTSLHLRYNKLTAVTNAIAQLHNLTSLDLSGNQLTAVPGAIGQLHNLMSLDLRHNQLTAVPDAIAQLPNLTSLDLSVNQLTIVPDALGQLRNLTSLELYYNQLTAVPEWIAQLHNLTSLGLGVLAAMPEWIGQLHNLTRLNLSGSKLTTVPEWIGQLHNLTMLNLSSNKLTAVPDMIAQLQNLTVLSLSRNQLTTVPEWIGQFHDLTTLNFRRNQLTAVPDAVAQLHNLTLLNLGENQLTKIPDAIAQLRSLQSLSLFMNNFSQVPDLICQLTDLKELYLWGNPLIDIPQWISKLHCLTYLSLDETRLIAIPEFIYELTALEALGLGNSKKTNYNNQIKKISPKILQLENLKKLDLEGNPVETPPLEVVKKGVEAIKDYFRQLEVKGKDHLYEAKLLIVGEGGAGKTTLTKKIENPNYQLQEDEASTEGIDVIQWQFPMENGQRFRVNIWDFGGQEIYHATHQFFLTKRSLYALVADTRKEDTDFYYWLNAVELLSDNSPLVIIKNEKQDRHREINERLLRGQFTNLRETLATNLATNRGLPEILKEIKHYICQLPHIGTPLPKTWVQVREALEKDSHNHINLDEYLDICQENDFTEQKDSLQLSGYLHDLGVCLHFQEDPLLKKTVILKPKWGTDAVYKVLDNKTVIRNLGQFTRIDLAHIWSAPEYTNMQDELLQLMINFKLCYKIPGSSDTYIVPSLLTANQPEYQWDATNNLILRYAYEFMPKGILTQFIVAMHPLIAEQKYVWKGGVILEKDQTRAEVIEYYGKREIKIRLAGKHKKELMAIVTYELDKIHASYRRLKYSQLIPCNCSTCKDSPEPHFYPYDELREFISNGQPEIQCRKKPYKMIDVLGLIDDVIDRRSVFEEERELGDMRPIKPTPKKFTKMRIFAASPSDMATERAKLSAIVDSLKPLAEDRGLMLEVVDWRIVVPDAGRPQQVIFDQLKPTTWDIFIGILWHRFGTRTGAANSATQKEYLSGTEEEFMTAYRLWQQFQQPRIMMYRCSRDIPTNALDPDQFKRVNEFFAQFDPIKGKHPALYQTFDTLGDFERLLRDNLQRVLLEYNETE